MQLSLRGLVLLAALAGGVGLISQGSAQAQGRADGFRIRDDGKFFSNEAKDKAERVITRIKHDYKKDLLIETYGAVPENLQGKLKEEGEKRFFANWARNRYEREGVEGILVLITREPRHLYVETGKRTEQKAFTAENRDRLVDTFMSNFKKGEFDKGLLEGVEYVRETLDRNIGKAAAGGAGAAAPGRGEKHVGFGREGGMEGMGIMGWVCIGLVVLLGLWLIVGLIRAFSGAGRPVGGPGGGYGGGYGPGGGGYAPAGGGGGGFMSSLLGGMLGGAAGMWAYDTFFRGGSTPSVTPPAYGGGTPVGGGGPDDREAGGGTGGDWGGGDAGQGGAGGDWGGGGDTGGAGGDWGGGGDTGGAGGDWGGGGDDGGAGGDWGGGGDVGGGGDWGGGGGGGDW